MRLGTPEQDVRAAQDIDDYCADPIGAYVQLAHGLAFCARPTVWGFAIWGRPSVADVGSMLPLMHLELAADVPPHASIVDLRYLDDADPSAFHVLARYLKDNAELIGERHTHVALI